MDRELLPAYLTALAAVVLVSVFNFFYRQSDAIEDTRYFLLVAAVFFAALHGGLGPGLLATVLSACSSVLFFLPPLYSIRVASAADAQRLTIFVLEGALLSWVGEVVRSADATPVPPWPRRWFLAIPIPVALVELMKATLLPGLALEFPFVFNFALVSLSAWLGGAPAGVVATILSALMTRFLFLPPLYSFAIGSDRDAIRMALFVSEGLLISLLNGKHLALRRFAESLSSRAQRHLEAARSGSDEARAVRAISRDTIWEWEIETGEIARTPSWQDSVSGALPEREDFNGWMSRIHPDDRGSIASIVTRALGEGREECRYGYRLLRPDGMYIPVSDHAFIVRDEAWKALRVIGRTAELARNTGQHRPVHRNEPRFLRMFQESPIAALILDNDFHIQFANPAAAGMFRTRPSALARAGFLPFLDAASHSEVLENLTALYNWRRLLIHFEQTLVLHTGEHPRVSVSAALITDFYAGTTGCLVLLSPIS